MSASTAHESPQTPSSGRLEAVSHSQMRSWQWMSKKLTEKDFYPLRLPAPDCRRDSSPAWSDQIKNTQLAQNDKNVLLCFTALSSSNVPFLLQQSSPESEADLAASPPGCIPGRCKCTMLTSAGAPRRRRQREVRMWMLPTGLHLLISKTLTFHKWCRNKECFTS